MTGRQAIRHWRRAGVWERTRARVRGLPEPDATMVETHECPECGDDCEACPADEDVHYCPRCGIEF